VISVAFSSSHEVVRGDWQLGMSNRGDRAIGFLDPFADHLTDQAAFGRSAAERFMRISVESIIVYRDLSADNAR
jgi:hypothetical protein